MGEVIKMISHFNRLSSTLSFEPLTAFYKWALYVVAFFLSLKTENSMYY